MEVAPFFVDFHHFLSIFTIFCRFSPFFIDFHDLRTFVAIYILSRFTHFFRKFFLAKIAFSATSHVFCMYGKVPKNGQFWAKNAIFGHTWPQRLQMAGKSGSKGGSQWNTCGGTTLDAKLFRKLHKMVRKWPKNNQFWAQNTFFWT